MTRSPRRKIASRPCWTTTQDPVICNPMKMLGVKSSWVCAAVRCTFTAFEVEVQTVRSVKSVIAICAAAGPVIGGKIDLDPQQMLCDRCTHGLSAVGFRDLPRVEDGAHQRAITLLNELVPEPGRPTNITLGTAGHPMFRRPAPWSPEHREVLTG